eukprot:scaffold590_cov383-Prasinococcus_capsulatus_cf.AAC.12
MYCKKAGHSLLRRYICCPALLVSTIRADDSTSFTCILSLRGAIGCSIDLGRSLLYAFGLFQYTVVGMRARRGSFTHGCLQKVGSLQPSLDSLMYLDERSHANSSSRL